LRMSLSKKAGGSHWTVRHCLPTARLAFIGLLLFCVCLQGLITQTHVHSGLPSTYATTPSGLATATAGAAVQDIQPLPAGDLRHCLLCQAAAHAGGFVDSSRAAPLKSMQPELRVRLRPSQLLLSRVLLPGSRQRGPPAL